MSRSAHKTRIIARLRDRDGDLCFYCGKPMRFPNDADPIHARKASIEHLIDHSLGGTMHHTNTVLAHDRCNANRSQMKTVAEKIASRAPDAPRIAPSVKRTLRNEAAALEEMRAYRVRHGVEVLPRVNQPT